MARAVAESKKSGRRKKSAPTRAASAKTSSAKTSSAKTDGAKTADESQATSPYQQRLGRLLREAVLFAAAAITAFLLAALLSYHATDPGWSGVGDGLPIQNMFGIPGAWFADVLLSLFGWLGYIFPWLVLYGGWLVFASIRRGKADALSKSVRGASLFLWLLSGCGLIWLLMGDTLVLPQGAGGIFGMAVGNALSGFINHLGAMWALFTIFVITLSTGLGFSWLVVADRVGHYVLVALGMAPTDGSEQAAEGPDKQARAQQKQAKAARKAEQKATKAERRQARATADKSKKTKKIDKKRVEPTLETPATPAASKAARKAATKRAKAAQLPLPISDVEGVEVPTYDPDKDSPLPPTSLLDPARESLTDAHDEQTLQRMSEQLEQHLADFNVQGKVVAVQPGPVVTRFELEPAPGVKVSQITNLAKDLARAMSTTSVRVVEVIPGKSVVGLEIPNANREIVALREIVEAPVYKDAASPLTVALGKDIGGAPVTANLAKMPHLLVAGTTGSGKSVAINAMILSILHKAEASAVRMILIDPKMLELSVYQGIPHLLTPVVTDMKDAANALRWCVGEMERRYKLMAALGVRNMAGFNRKVQQAIDAGTPLNDPIAELAQTNDEAAAGEPLPTLEPLPGIVIIIDELADLMMVVGKKVEELIARLAQKARAAGLHMILATQRPSVDVITGLIKANIPTRMSFQVASRVDSRTVLDQQGAESLLGHGDMLFLPPGTGFTTRVHGAFVDDHEVHKVVEYLKQVAQPEYIDEILDGGSIDTNGGGAEEDAEADPLYDQAVAIVTQSRKASISYVQRRLRVGYNRAARLIEQMEAAGLVGPAEGSSGREVLAPPPPPDD